MIGESSLFTLSTVGQRKGRGEGRGVEGGAYFQIVYIRLWYSKFSKSKGFRFRLIKNLSVL